MFQAGKGVDAYGTGWQGPVPLMRSLQSSAASHEYSARMLQAMQSSNAGGPLASRRQGSQQTLHTKILGRTWQDGEGLCSCASDGLFAVHRPQQQQWHQAIEVALQLCASRAEGCRQRVQAGSCHLGMRLPCSAMCEVSLLPIVTECCGSPAPECIP